MANLHARSMPDLTATLVIVTEAGPGDHRAVMRYDGATPVLHTWKGDDAAWTVSGQVTEVAAAIDGGQYEATVAGLSSVPVAP